MACRLHLLGSHRGSIVRKNQQCVVDEVFRHEQLNATHSTLHTDSDPHNHRRDASSIELNSGQVGLDSRWVGFDRRHAISLASREPSDNRPLLLAGNSPAPNHSAQAQTAA